MKGHSILPAIIIIISAILSMMGCDAPEYLKDSPETNYAEEYKLDIALLSEWAGNIIPIDNTFYIYSFYDFTFYFNYSYNYSTQEYTKQELVISQSEAYATDLSLMMFTVTDRDDTVLGTINCNLVETDCSACVFSVFNDADPNCPVTCYYQHDLAETTGVSVDNTPVYQCHYYSSGAANIVKVWDSLKDNDIPQIRIGNGDSFGVSADISSRFNDLPTAIMLNAMNMTADTFGNHSFDQSLEYLQNVINHAEYTYIGSNLQNVPQNLSGVVPYAIVEVPNQQFTPLKIGLISALDMEATSTVYPGRFGTLAIDNYCEVIHAIESAYNDGARAFFIQSHVIVDSNSMISLFNALFSFYDDTYQSFDANDLTHKTTCKSRIIPSPERLAQVFGKSNLNDIDLRSSENITKYNQLISSIKRDIYNGIIGVFGEGGSTILIPFVPNSDFNTDFYSLIKPNGDNTSFDTFNDLLKQRNILSPSSQTYSDEYFKSCYHDLFLPSYNTLGLNCYDYDIHSMIDKYPNDIHPIWFMQLPTKSSTTAQINVTISQDECNDSNCPNHSFTSFMDSYHQRPVVSSIFNYSTSEAQTEENTEDLYTYKEQCSGNDKILSKFSSCDKYFNNASIVDNLDELKESNNQLYETLMKCYDELSNHIHNTQTSDSIRNAQNVLECLYQPTAKCLINKTQYVELPFFSFSRNDLFKTTSQQDRTGSTPRTSLATDAIFNYYHSVSKTPYHAVFLNAGAVRTKDLTKIQDSVLRELVPYNNFVVHITMTPTALASTLQWAFYKIISDTTSFGGFPVISGMKISKSQYPNDIQEIWLSSLNQSNNKYDLDEPIYLKIKVTDKSGNVIPPSLSTCASNSTNAEFESCILQYLNDSIYNPNHTLNVDCPDDNCPIASYHITKDPESTLYYKVSTDQTTADNTYSMMLKLVYVESTGNFAPSITKDLLNSSTGNLAFILVKPNPDQTLAETELNILTLDYITNGGDGYNMSYPGIHIIQTFTDTDMRQIIHRYLFSSTTNLCETETGITPDNSITMDGIKSVEFEKIIQDPRLLNNHVNSTGDSNEP